jgi:hypothetical protein
LPAGAFDVTRAGFVLRWKNPNSYAAAGFTGDSRFLAASFLAALRAELPALADWRLVDYGGEAATDWSDRAGLTNGQAKIWASCKGWGANAYSKINLNAYAAHPENRRESSKSIEISVSADRPIQAIAKDVARRILPNLDAAAAELRAKLAKEKAAAKVITDKAAALSKRYPNLRIAADVESHRVTIATKYGAGIGLDGYSYLNGHKWCLTSERGRAIGLDDIDSRYGRAFLKLCNDN